MERAVITSIPEELLDAATQSQEETQEVKYMHDSAQINQYVKDHILTPGLLSNFKLFNRVVMTDLRRKGKHALKWGIRASLSSPQVTIETPKNNRRIRTFTLLAFSPVFAKALQEQSDPHRYLYDHPELKQEYIQYYCGLEVDGIDDVRKIHWAVDGKGKRVPFTI